MAKWTMDGLEGVIADEEHAKLRSPHVTEGETCRACHRTYTEDYWLPDAWWDAISNGQELLCPDCALERLQKGDVA